MSILRHIDGIGLEALGARLHGFAAGLYPICRSITGAGLRQTLGAIGERIPLKLTEVPTGTPVLDWMVPKEWNIRDAFLRRPGGARIVDFRKNNLHVMSYSAPVNAILPLEQMRDHLFTLPEYPGWIPYRTSYYRENWGLCMAHETLASLEDGDYEVVIDSELTDGHLTYGECFLPAQSGGQRDEEVLISCHVCHPSLANDNLSGITVATHLAELLASADRRYSYRFLFAPGTIGAISWLARNRESAARVRHGLVLASVGDSGGFHYKKSRHGDAEIDRAMKLALRDQSEAYETMDFTPLGYDERQFGSPGFNLPVGCLMRSVAGTYPQYHTSADDLQFLCPGQLAESLRVCAAAVDILEGNDRFLNVHPDGEPQLGRRGLYPATGGTAATEELAARLWVLNLSDGRHSLLEIAERSGLAFGMIRDAAETLAESGLLLKEQS